mmetsp:Transcript_18049/g.30035  ORF Transcript_18049/g.30035 Transcript_18049/m.30035 type:complete len:190 (-) Transcript_18049:130-699(-)
MELFLLPMSLPCAHIFCAPCLMEVANCPLCRKAKGEPQPAITTRNLVDSLLSGPQKEKEREERRRREEDWKVQKEQKEAEMEANLYRRLQTQMQRAQQQEKPFLAIDGPWDAEERQQFANGISKYRSMKSCARLYCSCVGLTQDFVVHADVNLLRTACLNLELMPPSSVLSRSEMRSKLMQFVACGTVI